MEVEKLEAGPDLDALVATKVMDWCNPDGYNYWMTLFGDGNFHLHALKATWHPSTDIAAAWEVVTKMQELGWEATIDNYTPEGPWSIEFDNDTRHAYGKGRTAPEAICRAALKALT